MKALFLGSKTLGICVFRCLYEGDKTTSWRIIHPLDVADTRSALEQFKNYAVENNVDLLEASSSIVAKGMILDFKPDIVFVCGWYWLINAETLSCAPLGFYGIHNSLLPKYRGCAPLVWSIINGDDEVGATLFRFAPGMDDGDILHQVRVKNDPKDNIGTLLKKIESQLIDTLPSTWKSLLDGSATLTKQDDSQATYSGQRIPRDGRINWCMPAEYVHNFIRAQTPPYPGAFSFTEGRKIVFLRTETDARLYFGTPGQVLQRSQDHVLVSCGGNSAIKVFEVSIDDIPIRPSKALASMSLRME